MTPDSTGLEGFLAHLAGAFELTNVRYAVVGSLASSFHGEPRGTRDIDIVVQLHRLDVGRLAAHFPEEHFYFDRDDGQAGQPRALRRLL